MMISSEQEIIFKAELAKITTFLLDRMKEDSHGYYWDTIHYDNQSNEFSYKFNHSIWNGTSGIILFFLSLYNYTHQQEYLEIAKKATNRTIKLKTRETSSNVSLFDGATGLIYLCLKLFELSENKMYVDEAIELAISNRTSILLEKEDDILGGKAGCLYVLTLLYHHTRNETILEDIKTLIIKLVDTSKVAKQGLRWGNGDLSVDALCGFSHGASGIGHVLLQVGTYFQDQDIIWLGEQAFLFEKEYYDARINNWMDLRWTSDKEQLPKLFEWEKETFIPTNFDANAWAHGATGIGLARLHAYRLTGKKLYISDINAVLERCIKDVKHNTKKSFLLFSGYGGIADFFILYSQLFKKEAVFNYAFTIGSNVIASAKLNGHHTWGVQAREDLGLMTGTAGIGYMLLRILHNGQYDSILHPTLPIGEQAGLIALGFSAENSIKKKVYSRYFGRTINLLHNAGKLAPDIFKSDSIDRFVEQLNKKVATLSACEIDYASDLLKFEGLITQLWKDHKGRRSFHTRLSLLKKDLEKSGNKDFFLAKKFITNPFIKIYPSKWNWGEENTKGTESELYWNILYATDTQVHHFIMSKFPAMILTLLQSPLSLYELYNKLTEKVSSDNQELFLQKLTEQIKELIERFFIRRINDGDK